MRRKIGTALDERLIVQAKHLAAREGRPLNDVLEDALRRYLALRRSKGGGSLVRRTAGAYRIEPGQLQQVMEEDLFAGE